MKATFIKDTDEGQKLWKVSPPAKYGYDYETGEYGRGQSDYVVTSKQNVIYSGWETYIFPANSAGQIINFIELEGSQKGYVSHETALKDAGYEIEQ